MNLSRARLRQGDLEAADQALKEGQEVLRSINAQGFLLDAGVMEVELRLAQGDLSAASELSLIHI